MASKQTTAKHTAPLILQTGVNGVCVWSLASSMPGSTLCLFLWGEMADLPGKLLDESLKHTNSYREGSCRPNRLSTGNFYLISLQTAQISDDWLILTKRKKEKRHKQTPFVLLPLNQTVTMSPFLASTSLTFTPCHSCPALISLVASSFLLRLCMELYLADAFCLFIFSATIFFSRFFSAALCF